MIDIFADSEYVGHHFAGIELTDTLIEDREFSQCSFTKCQFLNCQFKNCAFIDYAFTHCDISSLKVTGSRFITSRFEECKAIGIDWTKSSAFSLSLAFNKSVLDYSLFHRLEIADLQITDCRMREADFEDALIAKAHFEGSELMGTKFWHTDLRGANFAGAKGYAIDPRENKIKGATFSLPDALVLLELLEVKIEGFSANEPG